MDIKQQILMQQQYDKQILQPEEKPEATPEPAVKKTRKPRKPKAE